MTNLEDRLFMLDLAIVQLIAGILVTLGSTLFAISIGFGLTIPSAMQEVLLQMFTLSTEISPEIQQELVQESLGNYVLILASVGVILIIIGVVFASVRTKSIRRQIRANRVISNLISTDIPNKEPLGNEVDRPASEVA